MSHIHQFDLDASISGIILRFPIKLRDGDPDIRIKNEQIVLPDGRLAWIQSFLGPKEIEGLI